MKKAVAPLLLTGVLLSACSGGNVGDPIRDAVTPRPGEANTGVPAVDVPSATPTPSATPSALPSVSPAPAPILVLQPDGLSAAGSSVTLVFGKADQQTVRTVLTGTITGSVTSEQAQCPQGERSRIVVDGFSTLFDPSGTFVGWTERGSAERDVTTATGIGLRSTRDDLLRAYASVTFDGGAFKIGDGGLSGTLDKLQQIQVLSAGETCSTQ